MYFNLNFEKILNSYCRCVSNLILYNYPKCLHLNDCTLKNINSTNYFVSKSLFAILTYTKFAKTKSSQNQRTNMKRYL